MNIMHDPIEISIKTGDEEIDLDADVGLEICKAAVESWISPEELIKKSLQILIEKEV